MKTRPILISGSSGCGKSTVARLIAARAEARAFCLDDYYIRTGARCFVETDVGPVRSFEHPELYDGAALARDVAAHGGAVVAEGFCLFRYPEVLALDAFRFFIDLPFSTCAERRAKRTPRRPSDASFSLIGEHCDKQFVRPQAGLDGVVRVFGARSPEEIANDILRLSILRA